MWREYSSLLFQVCNTQLMFLSIKNRVLQVVTLIESECDIRVIVKQIQKQQQDQENKTNIEEKLEVYRTMSSHGME